jgi:hypothetical protein
MRNVVGLIVFLGLLFAWPFLVRALGTVVGTIVVFACGYVAYQWVPNIPTDRNR